MSFNSWQFICFFSIVVLIHNLLPSKAQNIWLLIASWYFYSCWNTRYILLLVFVTLTSYSIGLAVQAPQNVKKKQLLFYALFLLIGILSFFKLGIFILDHSQYVYYFFRVDLTHVSHPFFENFILPVGISFYTFQAIGYVLDVYNDRIVAERNFVDYALYISFFPQLVAGPIERADNILKQFKKSRKLDFYGFRCGLLDLIWGYFLKIVIADRIAIFVDEVYADFGATYQGLFVIIATFLFSIQIYCDFYGYSSIAMGAARMMGIHLMENFNAPYISFSVSEFWRRWHISLTSWFRDYLYIPLGGNRKGLLRKNINIFIVFLISGLWHGASLSFVVWGGINGVYQIIGSATLKTRNRICEKLNIVKERIISKMVRVVFVSIFVDIAWLFFRAGGLLNAIRCIENAFRVWNPWILFDGSLYTCGLDRANFSIVLLSLGILLYADIKKRKGISLKGIILEQNLWFRCFFIPFCIIGVLIFGIWGGEYNASNFIYFRF